MPCLAESSMCGRLRKSWSLHPCRPRRTTTWERSRWAIVARSRASGEGRRAAGGEGRVNWGPSRGVPAALAAATALASRALLGLHQGKRLPALTGAPLDPAPPIGRNAPVGEQALLSREAGHAAICLVAGLPARWPPALNCRVADGVAAAD